MGMYDRSKDESVVYEKKDGRLRVLKKTPGGSRTKQQFKEECDVNVIVQRAEKTGMLPIDQRVKQYGDFTNVPSYQESLETCRRAEEQFLMVGSRIRARFDNDPEKFLAFASNPKNQEELVKMGLAVKKQPTSPLPTRREEIVEPRATSTTGKASKKAAAAPEGAE